jgi:hypothetical protein
VQIGAAGVEYIDATRRPLFEVMVGKSAPYVVVGQSQLGAAIAAAGSKAVMPPHRHALRPARRTFRVIRLHR